ncbi:hypothetical protein ACFQ88_32200 [Paenibacillus sp. NPDC056579]|uniref:hypothetical protein n=1 Tax=Paenibacillus sp. NPDC056579 TaxID=3345871 RepID=UPI0036B06A02
MRTIFEKLLVMLLCYSAVLACEFPKLRKLRRHERMVYSILMLCSLYLVVIYVLDLPWPNLDEAVDYLFEQPGKRIVEAVKAPD